MSEDERSLNVDRLEARLTSHGIYVTDARLDGETVVLTYESIDAVPRFCRALQTG